MSLVHCLAGHRAMNSDSTSIYFYEIRELKRLSNLIQLIQTISQKSVLSIKKMAPN